MGKKLVSCVVVSGRTSDSRDGESAYVHHFEPLNGKGRLR